jgi:5-methylcytosine-specific restriction protein B
MNNQTKNWQTDLHDWLQQNRNRLIDATRNQQFNDLDEIGSKLLGNKNSLRIKPLYLYFPENFLSISNPRHLEHFSHYFDNCHLQGDITTVNLQLLAHLRSLPEFEDFDPPQMAAFLYKVYPPH